MIDLSSPLAGMQRAEQMLSSAAVNLASMPVSPDGAPVDTVDLSTAAVALLQARNLMAVNVKVAQTANEMAKHTLDLLG